MRQKSDEPLRVDEEVLVFIKGLYIMMNERTIY